jgi:copper oxidase (laccase) domain-containing protein
MRGNNFDVGKMHIEIYLPGEQVREGAIVIPKLPHGADIVTIQTGTEDLTDCDALLTKSHDFHIGIKTADCAPVCFSDGETIGIAHIGWRGLCLGLIEKTMTNFDTAKLDVYVAPFLHAFNIQKDFCYDLITQKFGEKYIEQKDGELIFHFKDAVSSLLPAETVYDTRSTEDISFPSYRRDKTTDRFVTLVSFR